MNLPGRFASRSLSFLLGRVSKGSTSWLWLVIGEPYSRKANGRVLDLKMSRISSNHFTVISHRVPRNSPTTISSLISSICSNPKHGSMNKKIKKFCPSTSPAHPTMWAGTKEDRHYQKGNRTSRGTLPHSRSISRGRKRKRVWFVEIKVSSFVWPFRRAFSCQRSKFYSLKTIMQDWLMWIGTCSVWTIK